MIKYLFIFFITFQNPAFASGWYSTLQGAASDVEQSDPSNGDGLAYNTTDKEWEFTDAFTPSGGTTGQVLTKNTNSDYDYSWISPASGSGNVGIGTTGEPSYYATNGTTVSPFINVHYVGANVGIGSVNPGQKLDVQGTVRATAFMIPSGTSSQFLKANGTTDPSTYLTTSSASGTYVPFTGSPSSVNLGTNDIELNRVFDGSHSNYIQLSSSSNIIIDSPSSGGEIYLNPSLGAVTTGNNMLDDGVGNMTIAENLTVNASETINSMDANGAGLYSAIGGLAAGPQSDYNILWLGNMSGGGSWFAAYDIEANLCNTTGYNIFGFATADSSPSNGTQPYGGIFGLQCDNGGSGNPLVDFVGTQFGVSVLPVIINGATNNQGGFTGLGGNFTPQYTVDVEDPVIGSAQGTLGTGSITVTNCSTHSGQASCWATTGAAGYCTSVVGIGGTCTCAAC